MKIWCLYLQIWLSPWRSTAQLIGLQADSTQGANQALIRPLWFTDDGSDSGSRVRSRLIARGPPRPRLVPENRHESLKLRLSGFTRFTVWQRGGNRKSMCVLLKKAALGLGPQCPLLAPKSSVDPLTHWFSTFMRKSQNSDGKNCKYKKKIDWFPVKRCYSFIFQDVQMMSSCKVLQNKAFNCWIINAE